MTRSAIAPEELRLEAADAVRASVGFDMWAWSFADPDSLLYAGAQAQMAPQVVESLPRYFMLQEAGTDPNPRVVSASSARSTAVLSDLTHRDLARSVGWDECLRPHGVGDVMATACRDGAACWGWLVLHRGAGEHRFSADEAELLGDLAPALGPLARRASVGAPHDGLAAERPPPGVLIIDESLRESEWTHAARQWRDRLTPIQRLIFPGIVGRALSNPEPQMTASVRLRTTDGTWAKLDGAPLEGASERQVAIKLRAAGPEEVLDILSRAYRLTRRESQIAGHLASGLTTQQVAERLLIAPFTVKDHLKAMFRKVAVGTRGQLVSALTGHLRGPAEADDSTARMS